MTDRRTFSKAASEGSASNYRSRPVQNFPDYLRYVARKSKAGFDKVHEEIYKIYSLTIDRRSPENEPNKSIRQERWANSVKNGSLLWASTGSVKPQSSFISYISEETESENNTRVECDDRPYRSASPVEKLHKAFTFDNFRYSTGLESSHGSDEGDGSEYQVPSTWVQNKPSPNFVTNEAGYLPMDSNNPGNILQDKTIATCSQNSENGKASKSSPNQNENQMNFNFRPKMKEFDADYMNAPRKPVRSMFTPSPAAQTESKKSRIEARKDIHSALPVGVCSPPTESPHTGNCHVIKEQEENIYMAPDDCRDSVYQNIASVLSSSSLEGQTPENVDKNANNIKSGYCQRTKLLEKSISAPQTNIADDDDFYQIPPLARPLFKAVDSTDDFYQTPPSPRRLQDTRMVNTEDDFYEVPPSNLPVTKSKPKSPKPQPRKLDLNTDYDMPPTPVPVAKLAKTNQSLEELSKECDSKEEFFRLDTVQLVECLNTCKLSRLATVCEERKLNGESFRNMTAEQLREEPFSMNYFYIPKLFKVINGWRPKQ